MQPNFVAKKTAWSAVTFWRALFFWLIVPLIVMLVDIFIRKSTSVEFYDDYVVTKSGILSKKERRTVFTGVISVSVDQSLLGRMLNYGDVQVDVVGKWDVDLNGISNPNALKEYLENRLVAANSVKMHAFE